MRRSRTELTDLVAAANPLTAERAGGLSLGAAGDDLLASVVATPLPDAPTRPRRRPRLAFTLAAAGVAVLVLLGITYGPGRDRQAGGAWAAEQVRFADASPLVLLAAPGWRVAYVDEESAADGELHFRAGGAAAQLNWMDGPLADWLKDRAESAVSSTTAPALGTTAHIYRYPGGTPAHQDLTALLNDDGRVLELRSSAGDLAAFEALLTDLRRVDADRWLTAMPASAITTADRARTVDQMLQGIPLPAGFDTAALKAGDRVRDRYQVGADVLGAIACGWYTQWGNGLGSGDRHAVAQAKAALGSARRWPLVHELNRSGDYGHLLVQDAERVIATNDLGEWAGGTPCGG